MNMAWITEPAQATVSEAAEAARRRQDTLTKPPGSLGRLEELAVSLAGMQGSPRPVLERVHIAVFAADHGVAAEGVSAYPQAVTVEMVRNFAAGGAAIAVLARTLNATLEVVDVGTVADPGPLPGVISQRAGAGTANFRAGPAMAEEELEIALAAGRDAARRACDAGAQLFIGGEMGIGNTTSASAIICALLDVAPELATGPGTGLTQTGVSQKAEVVQAALNQHRTALATPLDVLRCLGGFEIAALAGAYVYCAQSGVAVVVDGLIAGAAALLAARLCPGATHWFFHSHISAEPGHAYVLRALEANPLLNLGMRLGEGSGAAVAVPLLRLACALHNEMATFGEAGVSERQE